MTINKTLIGLAVVGVLTGTTVSAQGGDMKSVGKPFEGVVVQDVVVIERLPTEVQSGSIRIRDRREQAMAGLAKVDAAEAIRIATTAFPGKVVETQLDEENGFLVWKVTELSSGGQEVQLKLDAGSGRLLAAEKGDGAGQMDRDHDDRKDQREVEHSSWKFWQDDDRDEHGGERE